MAFVEKSGKRLWRVRYAKDNGGFGTISGFTSKTAAENKADEIEADQRRGQFLDPDGGKLTLAEWSIAWFDALDVAATTEAQYRSLAKNHILARWGTSRLDAISGLAVHTWKKKLRAEGYAQATVTTIRKVMSMMLATPPTNASSPPTPSNPAAAANAATRSAPNASGPPPNKPSAWRHRQPRWSATGPPS